MFRRHSSNLPERNSFEEDSIGLGSLGWSNTRINTTSYHYVRPAQSWCMGSRREIKSAEAKTSDAMPTMLTNLARFKRCTMCAGSVRKLDTGCENVMHHTMDVKAPTANYTIITLGSTDNIVNSLRGKWVSEEKTNASARRTLKCPTMMG
jgi:hypothetical protein